MLKNTVHHSLNYLYSKSDLAFREALKNCENSQNQNLQNSLKTSTQLWDPNKLSEITDYKSFTQKIPITNYAFYEEKIAAQMNDQIKIRWEPTSGSTQKRKWIPYNQAFLNQLHQAAHPWLKNLYKHSSELLTGSHYWSLSWLPEDLRKNTHTDDSKLFPFWQRALLKQVFPVPRELAVVSSSEAFWFANLVILCCQEDLSLISVWSPTLLLQIISSLKAEWSSILKTLTTSRWDKFAQELKNIKIPKRRNLPQNLNDQNLNVLWPKLKVISCWDSSTSEIFANELKLRLPHVELQGKGLWATEGVVTIPYERQYPLAIRSHFYEFRDLDSKNIYLAHQLKTGMKVQVLLSAANGFLRYELNDILEVLPSLSTTPCFRFLGRVHTIDMVGEKMDHAIAQSILKELRLEFSGAFLSLRACLTPRPHYRLVCSTSQENTERVSASFEKHLKEIHHYAVARECGQLTHSEVDNFTSLEEAILSIQKSSVSGQVKIESLLI